MNLYLFLIVISFVYKYNLLYLFFKVIFVSFLWVVYFVVYLLLILMVVKIIYFRFKVYLFFGNFYFNNSIDLKDINI